MRRNAIARRIAIALLAAAGCAAPLAAQQVEPLGAAAAEEPRLSGTLTLDEVLASSARHAPAILEALAKARAADGRITAARGAFDLVFDAETYSYLTGFYDGQYVSVQATRPLDNNGGYLTGGYRVSRGDFPTYNDIFFTNQVGELKARGVYALLRDSDIDARRAGIDNARLARERAEAETAMIALGVQQRALEAYNRWVGAGQQVEIYRRLLALSEERQSGLARQVQLGARPDIILTENRQNILRRQALLVQAERDLAAAANRLSLFLRDKNGRPLQPNGARLPRLLPELVLPTRIDPADALERRPELQIIENRLAAARLQLRLDENQLRPQLDLWGEVSNDFGALGEGGSSRDGFETIFGLKFSVPLQRRAARGRIAATEAEMQGIAFARQQVEEQVANTIADIAIGLEAAERLLTLAREEEQQAEKLASGERRLFTAGASDFFLVNLREEAAANASIKRLQAEYNVLAAKADLAAALADFDTLGLEEDRPRARDADRVTLP